MKSFVRNALLGAAGLAFVAMPAYALTSTTVGDTPQASTTQPIKLAQSKRNENPGGAGYRNENPGGAAYRNENPGGAGYKGKKAKKPKKHKRHKAKKAKKEM